MCGGAIISDLIPRNRNRRVSAPDFWPVPDSFVAKPDGYETDLGRPIPKRSQHVLGKSLLDYCLLWLVVYGFLADWGHFTNR